MMSDVAEGTNIEENSFVSDEPPAHSLPTPEELKTEAAIRNAGLESTENGVKDKLSDVAEGADVEENSFVSDDTPAHSLPTPEEIKTETSMRDSVSEITEQKVKDKPNLRYLGLCGILFIIGLIVALTGFFLEQGTSAMDKQKLVREQSAILYLREVLPDASVMSNEDSPQFRAMEWIVWNDPLHVSIPNSQNDDDADKFMERYALTVLYFSTDGENWDNNMNFLTGKETCEWNSQFKDFAGKLHSLGAICDDGVVGMNVNEIWIPSNGLKGKVPFDELMELKSLRTLAFEYNENLRGSLPENIGDMTTLENLSLSNNLFSGKLPMSMAGMRSLKRLMVDDNDFTGEVSPVVYLPNLELVYLEDNFFEGKIGDTFFASAPNLKHLDISNNKFSGTVPAHLFEASKLEALDMNKNFKISGNLPQFPVEQTNLKVLSLHGNSISGEIPASIGNLRGLRHLDLSDNQLTGDLNEAMGDLKQLDHLFLANNAFNEGPIPNFLRDLTRIVDLSLKKTNRTGVIPDWIGTDLKQLRLLDLDGNKLKGQIPETLSQLKTLVFLLLNRNQLTGQVPQGLNNIPLEVFVLDNNDLSGDLDFLCDEGDLNPLDYMVADCGGNSPEITCTEGTCCRECCSDDDEGCNDREWMAEYDPIWESHFRRNSYIFGDGLKWVPTNGDARN